MSQHPRSELTGVGIGRGIAVGTVQRMPEPLAEPVDEPFDGDRAAEKRRVAEAVERTAATLRQRGADAGGTVADILLAQAEIAADPTLAAEIDGRIDGGKTGERAVLEAVVSFQEMLTGLGGYMAERAADLHDIGQRIIALLRGVEPPGVPESAEPFVLVARDLAPADTAALDLTKVLAFVTEEGGPTSHTAILAREKSIVAVVGVAGAGALASDQEVIVDAQEGNVIADPTPDDVSAAEAERERRGTRAAEAPSVGQLADGTSIPVLVNIGSVDDLESAVAVRPEGVGLFRTEFLFLGSDRAPTVDEQCEAYAQVLRAFDGQKVVFRLLDAGADKPLAFLTGSTEENPALGVRGIRALRRDEQILHDQLVAIARAAESTSAEPWVMAPMVATVEECRFVAEAAHREGLSVAGAMVEVPSLALSAAEALPEVDFVSIGTNDLTQYTLAADRLLGPLASMQDPWHPAVLRLIKMVGDAGAQTETPVGVCGEAAADPLLAVVLVGLGATSLSMSPSAVDEVRAELSQHTADDARRCAEAALGTDSAENARAAVRGVMAPSH